MSASADSLPTEQTWAQAGRAGIGSFRGQEAGLDSLKSTSMLWGRRRAAGQSEVSRAEADVPIMTERDVKAISELCQTCRD